MKKLTLIAAAFFAAATSFAQTSLNSNNTFNNGATANQHGKTVSAAAQSSTHANVDAEAQGEYVREIANSKKEEANQNKEAAKALATEKKEQAKQLKKEQAKQLKKEQKEALREKKESAKAQGNALLKTVEKTEASASANVKANGSVAQETATEQASLVTETALGGAAYAQASSPEIELAEYQGKPKKGQKDKADKEQKDKPARPEKGEKADKSKKDQDNHGNTVSTTAKETVETGAEKGQVVKEVATAKRQEKPEKVEAEVKVDATVKAPKSAARPGRGAARTVRGTATTVTKTTGNTVKKVVKPVKVGGTVGGGAVIKVGKN